MRFISGEDYSQFARARYHCMIWYCSSDHKDKLQSGVQVLCDLNSWFKAYCLKKKEKSSNWIFFSKMTLIRKKKQKPQGSRTDRHMPNLMFFFPPNVDLLLKRITLNLIFWDIFMCRVCETVWKNLSDVTTAEFCKTA